MEQIQLFNYENQEVRTIFKDGEIWFITMDIAQITGHRNIRASGNRYLDTDEVAISYISDKSGRLNQTQIVNESGLYKLLFRSKLPKAKVFTKYVTSVILPTIRKTGSFNGNEKYMQELANDKQEAQELTEQKNRINKRIRFLRLRIEDNEKTIFQPYNVNKKRLHATSDQTQLTIFE